MFGVVSPPSSVKNNTAGTTAPAVTDDASKGYSKTSVWIDGVASPAEIYVCVDNTVGAAVWILSTLTVDQLGTMALQNANAVAITGGAIAGTTLSSTVGMLSAFSGTNYIDGMTLRAALAELDSKIKSEAIKYAIALGG